MNTYRKVIRLPNGKRKWITAKSEQELNEKLLDLQIQVNAGVDVSESITFGEYALKWYRINKEPTVGANQRYSILNALNNHILPHLSGIPMQRITQMQVQYVFTLLNGKSQSLISKVRTILKEIFESAQANRLIISSPLVAIHANAAAKKEKRAVSAADEAALLAKLSEDRTYYGRRAYLLALLGFKTGLRRGELAGLMLSDIDLAAHTLTVNRAAIWPDFNHARISDARTQTKTKAAHRTVPIPDTAYQVVKSEVQIALNEGTSLYLFHGIDGNMLSKTEIDRAWARVQKASPVPFTMHEMRHTYCTRILQSGISVREAQYFMGHADPTMTMGVYNHFIEAEQRDPASAKLRACL